MRIEIFVDIILEDSGPEMTFYRWVKEKIAGSESDKLRSCPGPRCQVAKLGS
jgi:hypothetical protein